MAYHFSANQFEEGYRAKRLRNWEVPKWYPEHPRTPITTTEFVVNSRGHLLPGIPKGNPWGRYKGTWDLPHRITKEIAEEISAPPRKLQSLWSKRKAPSHILQQTEESEPEHLPAISPTDESFQRRNRSSSALDLQPESQSKVEPLLPIAGDHESSFDIQRGYLEPRVKEILDSVVPEKTLPEPPGYCRAIEVLQEGKEQTDVKGSEVDTSERRNLKMVPEKETLGGPLINDYSAFQVAKRFHDENLKHQPLPDVVDDPVFKALASNKDPFPGRALKIKPDAAAIGWKSSGVPGPTKCSKVKVYRPKTAAMKVKHTTPDARPKTGDPQKDRKVLPIDLAICWDLSPQDKPKRSLHIDGSHGGEAPSVFSVVRSEEQNLDIPGSAQAVATHVANCVEEDNVGTLPPKIGEKIITPSKRVTNKSAIMSKVQQIPDSRNSSFHSLSPESAEFARKNPKTAWTAHDTSKELSERLEELKKQAVQTQTENLRKDSNDTLNTSLLLRQKHHQSTPNLSTTPAQKECNGSNCGTESSVESKSKDLMENKEENKMAKTVAPRKAALNLQEMKSVKIPKMRPPYAKKNYSISTLIPPFSLWPDHHGQEYPEHWRLASVYQHSYKPVDCRRKPLLASVYQ